jgi:hypothetical protein
MIAPFEAPSIARSLWQLAPDPIVTGEAGRRHVRHSVDAARVGQSRVVCE